jgi:hypothetical protein
MLFHYHNQPSGILTSRLLCYHTYQADVKRIKGDLYQAPAMLYTQNMATKRGLSKPLPAAVELGRRGGKARVAQLSHEELQELGRRGGQSRAKRLSKEQRREIARKAVQARWEKARGKKAAEAG